MAATKKPPFRADHVGSLLRPKEVLEARDKVAKGSMTKTELRKLEGEHGEAKRFERESKRVASAYQQENKLGYVVDVGDILSLR